MSEKRVLIADDDTTSRKLLEAMLKKWGYEVVSASSGDEAWDALRDPASPDIAILDWIMPGKKGVEICRLVRESSFADKKYLILLTAKIEKEDIVLAFEAGADDYVTKPFHKLELQARIRSGERIVSLQKALGERIDELQKAVEENKSLGNALNIWKKLAHKVSSPRKDEEAPVAKGKDSEIFDAIEKNDYDKLDCLMKDGADFNVKDSGGSTPLHLTSSTRIGKLILSSGVDINARNNPGQTPLHWAAYNNHKDVAELLLTYGARVNVRDNDGLTPLHLTSQEGHLEVTKMLVEKNAELQAKNDEGATPLMVALQNGRHDVAAFFILKGSDLRAQNSEGSTPLHMAVAADLRESARLLIMAGALIEARDNAARLPIHLASSREMVELILGAGGKPDAKDESGMTLLHYAAASDKVDMVENLLSKGVDVNTKDGKGATPLHMAAAKGHKGTTGLLITRGALVSEPDDAGRTPLHIASQIGQVGMVKMLISAGANINARDNENNTPLDLAAKSGAHNVEELLRPLGALPASREEGGKEYEGGGSFEEQIIRDVSSGISDRIQYEDEEREKSKISKDEIMRFGRVGSIRARLIKENEIKLKAEDALFPPRIEREDIVTIKRLGPLSFRKGFIVLYEAGDKAPFGRIQKIEMSHQGVNITLKTPPPSEREITMEAKRILGQAISVERLGKTIRL